jgi:leader peptidase (prepilin peptidase)/N-methyltransferase
MLLVAGCALLGAAVGALAVPRAAYRFCVPHGRPVRDACGACAAPLPAGPAGWLGGGCRACRARLGPRRLPVALLAALLAGGVGARFGAAPALAPYLLVTLLGVLLAAVDVRCRRLPDPLVLPAVPVVAALLAVAGGWPAAGRALLAAAALAGGYLLLSLLPGAPVGGGDVTLAGLLGLCLGWLGWPHAVLGAGLPFLLNAPVLLVLLALRRAGRGSRVPFGPAMLVAAWLVVVAPVLLR